MSKTSKKYFDEKFKNRIWKEILINAKKSENKEDLKKALKVALTDEEILLMEKRLAVKELLREGITFSEISRRADVTRSTVYFIRRGFKRPVWEKMIYSKDTKKSNWRDPLKPQLRPYRFVPRTRRQPLRRPHYN